MKTKRKKRVYAKAKYTEFLSVPCTPAQKAAILRAARLKTLDFASYGRMKLTEGTDYDVDKDPDMPPTLPVENATDHSGEDSPAEDEV